MRNIYIYSDNTEIEKNEKQTIRQFFEKYKVKYKITFTMNYKDIIQNILEIDIIFIYDDVWDDAYKILESQANKNEENSKEVYIVKSEFPIDVQKLEINKQKLLPKDNIIVLKTKNEIIRIQSKHILYFENVDRKVFVHTLDGIFELAIHIKELQKNLKHDSFLSAYVSVLVNPYWVKKIIGYEIILKNGETLPLSQKKSSAFRKKFKDYLSLES